MAAFACLLLVDLNFSISSGRKEKYATSAADIKADPKSSKTRIISPVMILISSTLTGMAETVEIVENVYSGSNFISINKTS